MLSAWSRVWKASTSLVNPPPPACCSVVALDRRSGLATGAWPAARVRGLTPPATGTGDQLRRLLRRRPRVAGAHRIKTARAYPIDAEIGVDRAVADDTARADARLCP